MIADIPGVVDIKAPFSLLATAVSEENTEVVELLLDLGCNPNIWSRVSSAPLTRAIQAGNETLVRILLENGADPNTGRSVIGAVIDKNSRTAVLLSLLEEFNADLGRSFPLGTSDEQINAMTMAEQWGNDAAVEFLQERGIGVPETQSTATPVEPDSNEVVRFFEKHFGSVKKQAIVEIIPSSPQIAVHVVPPSERRSHTTLFTTGMSDHRMRVPEGANSDYAFAELFIEVQGEMPTDLERLASPGVSWPIDWLRTMAKYPMHHDKWLGGPFAIVDNGDPPEPLAPDIKFCSLLMLAERSFARSDGTLIQLYRLTPLYPEEVELERRAGMSALMRAFDRFDVPFVFNRDRPNVGAQS